MKKIVVTAFLSLLVLNFNLVAEQKPKMPPPKVDVYKIGSPKDINIDLSYPAVISAYQEISVVSRVSGVLKSKHFKEGEYLKAGTLLYKVEDTIYKAKYDAASANLKMANIELENALKDWERNQRLYKTKSISDEKRDNSLYAYELAKAKVELAKANLAQVKLDLNYTNVQAPIDGFASIQKVDVGNYVVPTQQLLDITQNKKLYIDFSIPSSDYTKIKNNIWTTNQKQISISIILDGKDTGIVGVIDFIDVNVDKLTSTVKIRALIENEKGLLSAGSFVRVKLNNMIQKNVVMIPQKALLQSAKGTIVFIANEGKVEVRPVAIADEIEDKYTLSWSMLKPEDQVIVNNFFRAKPAQAVIVDKVINEIKEQEEK